MRRGLRQPVAIAKPTAFASPRPTAHRANSRIMFGANRCSARAQTSRLGQIVNTKQVYQCRRCQGRADVRRQIAHCNDRACGSPHLDRRADAQRRRSDRRARHLSPGSPAVHRQADRAGEKFRRPGRHRHREHAAAQRTARSRCSSRPPPPTCSRSSATRPSICRPCSKRLSSRRRGCARRTIRQSSCGRATAF